jgi:hypothetical protein
MVYIILSCQGSNMNALYIDQSETLLHNPADKTSIQVRVLEHT